MTFLKKLLGKNEPVKRVRICQECGMPVAEHKDWCSIYTTMKELERRQAARTAATAATPAPSEG